MMLQSLVHAEKGPVRHQPSSFRGPKRKCVVTHSLYRVLVQLMMTPLSDEVCPRLRSNSQKKVFSKALFFDLDGKSHEDKERCEGESIRTWSKMAAVVRESNLAPELCDNECY